MAEKLGDRRRELQGVLDRMTVPAAAELSVPLPGNAARCAACAHRCLVREGKRGVCRVRHNHGGVLMAPHGYAAGCNADPIEKKPFFHVLPGSLAYSFGMLGCNFHCRYCQNWLSSQTFRDDAALALPRPATAEALVAAARASGAASVISTYNEPLISAEWAFAVFEKARAAGMLCGFVSNGYATPEVLDYLRPVMGLCKVDLKSFSDQTYRRMGGKLAGVLGSIERLLALGCWVEVVTLLVPGLNDSGAELSALTRFLAGLSPDIPWHVTGFHPMYRMEAARATTAEDLARAVAIGKASGLRYVYAGNRPGRTGGLENTHCPGCGMELVGRTGFYVRVNRITGGCCPGCGAAIPGVWSV